MFCVGFPAVSSAAGVVTKFGVQGGACAPGAHRLGVDRVHGEEEGCDEGQVRLLEDVAFTGVQEQASGADVETHVDEVEIQRRQATQHNV